ncbi:MAG: hypothetical protein ACOCWH_02250 [Spirochaetota bacterium]
MIYRHLTGLALAASLVLLLTAAGRVPEKDRIRDFTFVRSETAGHDSRGNRITVDYYESDKSTLTVTTIPRVTMTGTFVAVGNEPFTMLVFQTDDGRSYHIPPDMKDRFWKLQGKTITLTGRVEKRTVKSKRGDKRVSRNFFHPDRP